MNETLTAMRITPDGVILDEEVVALESTGNGYVMALPNAQWAAFDNEGRFEESSDGYERAHLSQEEMTNA